MGEDLFTTLSIDNHHHHPSTLLSMDSGGVSRDELDHELSRPTIVSRPPDINLPLASEQNGSSLQSWNLDPFDTLDVSLGSQSNEHDAHANLPKTGRKCTKRLDSVWGAWFFFCYYFKPVLNDKSKCKVVRDGNGASGFDKSDLELDVFLVQHDMENMYMWVFKKRPENALGKMQLRSYMNGHSRQGERPFPFSVDKGFVRSHRMQRKHYRGLSNPQCVHGIELVSSPNFEGVDEEEQKRWVELTGRDLNFTLPPEASEFCSWRNLPTTEFELERHLPPLKTSTSNSNSKKLLNGSSLNLSNRPPNQANGGSLDLSPVGNNKRKKDMYGAGSEEDCYLHMNQPNGRLSEPETHPAELPWMNDFSGVMRNVYGPVTAAKTIYEDEQGYLIITSLPFSDLKRVKVTWWNNLTHGVVKISSVSTACMPYIKRNGRTFEVTDPSPEHCPPGEFVREIPLPTRIPDDAKLEAYEDEAGNGLEIMVPKHRTGPEEHEVRVCLRSHSGVKNELMLS
ncbi:uncharacterized protein LOC116210177 [Punica granatum]|uniref:Uncharacterized protein LOC116210177 n=2 Tax=Punica granatum TaxID=22663 RepID=A0A6P8DVU6_PUNGR|nr:uncharacterized protein LOC116210177 [Punica granatum]XP_031399860.1 uncharacterized protein LOC116210177 [Punica granatum]OWM68812.1 hypothetical protein CDL15_Pgr024999 [Punica granatum]PKI36427.1 hypothetical protein CRG98_043209 [Punica granatum]